MPGWPHASGFRTPDRALLTLFLVLAFFAAHAAAGSSKPFISRHLLVQVLQQPVQPGLGGAYTDLQQLQATEPSTQPKSLSSVTAPGSASSSVIVIRNVSTQTNTTSPPRQPASPPQPAAAGEASPPQDPGSWQRRTMQLPPHVYLISFVMLLAIMAALLGCHCYRMCRIARRMRQAAELGVTLTPAGAALSKRTPQSVIEALPVAKYAVVHSSKTSATSARKHGCTTQCTDTSTAHDDEAGSGPAGQSSVVRGAAGRHTRSNSFLAAAMQVRDQVTRAAGVSTLPSRLSVGSAASARDHQEIVPSPATHTTADGPTSVPFKEASSTAAPMLRAQPSSSNGGEPCAICFDEFVADDDVKQLPCGHYFHPGCIDEWLVRDITCPLCKAMVLDESLIEQQELMAAALQESLISSNAISRRLRRMRRQQQQQEEHQQEQEQDGSQPNGQTSNRRSRRQQRSLRDAPQTEAAVTTSTNASSSGAGAGTSGVVAASTDAPAPHSNATRDELIDMMHMVMLGIPRSRHPISFRSQQQQRLPPEQGTTPSAEIVSGNPGRRQTHPDGSSSQPGHARPRLWFDALMNRSTSQPAGSAGTSAADVELGLSNTARSQPQSSG